MLRLLTTMIAALAIGQAPASGPDRIAMAAIALVVNAPTEANQVWPGFSLPSRSFAVQTPSGLFLHTPGPAPPGFQRVRGVWFQAGPLPGLGAGIAIDHPIGELRVTIVRAGSTADQTARTLYHEGFHGFQRAQSKQRPILDSRTLAITVDQAARIEIERRLLADALLDQKSASLRLREAMALRRERSAAGGEALQAAERFAEWNEGLAEYVGIASAARALKQPDQGPRQTVAASLKLSLASLGGSPDERLVRARSYATGAALALLLDELEPGWKLAIEDSPLDEMAARAAGLRESDADALAASARRRYRFDELRASPDPPWGSLVVMSEAAFFDLAPFHLVVEMSSQARSSFSLQTRAGGDLNGMHRPIPGVLLLPRPTRFDARDGGLTVTVRGRPVRNAGPPAEPRRSVTILLAAAPLLDGKPIAPGEMTRSSLEIVTEGVEIMSATPVRLVATARRVTISRIK
jgi:hypothetical protein